MTFPEAGNHNSSSTNRVKETSLSRNRSTCWAHFCGVELKWRAANILAGSKFNTCGIKQIGMCGPRGYGFSAHLVINRVSILAKYRVWLLQGSLDMGMSLFPHYRNENQALHIYAYGLVGSKELIITQL